MKFYPALRHRRRDLLQDLEKDVAAKERGFAGEQFIHGGPESVDVIEVSRCGATRLLGLM